MLQTDDQAMLNRSKVSSATVCAALVVCGYPALSWAEGTSRHRSPVDFDMLLRLGIAGGGDNAASWTITYPSREAIEEMQSRPGLTVSVNPIEESPSVDSGFGSALETGLIVEFPSASSSIEISYSESVAGLERTRIDLIPLYHLRRHHFGLGLSYQTNLRVKGSASDRDAYVNTSDYYDSQLGALPPIVELSYKDALGIVAQYAYSFGRGEFSWGIRGTFIGYESEALRTVDPDYNETTAVSYSRSISGNSAGIFFQLNMRQAWRAMTGRGQ